jgi:hypothetical protein
MESPRTGGEAAILTAIRAPGAARATAPVAPPENGKPGQEPEAACRAGRSDLASLPSGFATRTWCPHCAGSKDCFQEGPGLPRDVALPAGARSLEPRQLRSGLAPLQMRVFNDLGPHDCGAGPAPGIPDRRQGRAGHPTSGGRARLAFRPATNLGATERCQPQPDTPPRLGPTPVRGGSALNFGRSTKPTGIRVRSIILDQAFSACLESAPFPGLPART